MRDNVATRRQVAEAYAKAVAAPAGASCCGEATTKGVAAALAGYRDDELAELPSEAVVNSFGCGNPVAFSDLQPGDVVVDLGSGAGLDMLLAARKVGPTGHVIGIDMTEEMIAKARENIEVSGLTNLEVRMGIIEDLPVDDESVDWVISNCVINLSPEKPRVFAEIARVLKPGGRMSVSDIVVEDLPSWVRESEALYDSCVAGAISEADYLAGLEEAGFVDVHVGERLVYDVSQLAALVESELDSAGSGSDEQQLSDAVAESMAGRVWSARVSARKPS